MNFQQIVNDLRKVMTLEAIAHESGLKARSAVHGISRGTQASVTYDVGVKLIALRKRKARQIYSAIKAEGKQ